MAEGAEAEGGEEAAMTEEEYWTAVEYLVSGEIGTLRENRLQFLFCDGFYPDNEQPLGDAVVGNALISQDDGRSFNSYRFRLLLRPGMVRPNDSARWDAMLPPVDRHDWLRIDRDEKWIEIRL